MDGRIGADIINPQRCPVPTEISVCAASNDPTRSSTRSSRGGSSRCSSSRNLSKSTYSSQYDIHFENGLSPRDYQNYNDIPDDASSISDPSAYLSKSGRRRSLYERSVFDSSFNDGSVHDRMSILKVLNAGKSLSQMRGHDAMSHNDNSEAALSQRRRITAITRRIPRSTNDNKNIVEPPPSLRQNNDLRARLKALDMSSSAMLSSSRSVKSGSARSAGLRSLRSRPPISSRPCLPKSKPSRSAFSTDDRFSFKDGLYVLTPSSPQRASDKKIVNTEGDEESTITDRYVDDSVEPRNNNLDLKIPPHTIQEDSITSSGHDLPENRPSFQSRRCLRTHRRSLSNASDSGGVSPLISPKSQGRLRQCDSGEESVPSESPAFDNDNGFVYRDGMFVPKDEQKIISRSSSQSYHSRTTTSSKKPSIEDDTTTERYSGIGKHEDVDVSTYRESGQESLGESRASRSTKDTSAATVKNLCALNNSKTPPRASNTSTSLKSEDTFTPKYVGQTETPSPHRYVFEDDLELSSRRKYYASIRRRCERSDYVSASSTSQDEGKAGLAEGDVLGKSTSRGVRSARLSRFSESGAVGDRERSSSIRRAVSRRRGNENKELLEETDDTYTESFNDYLRLQTTRSFRNIGDDLNDSPRGGSRYTNY